MKTTILFLPGLLCDAALWARQTAAFGADHTCVVADMTQDDTLGGMAERAMRTMPERFSLVGLSMGGYVAMEIMRRAPHRVERLALLDTSARADLADRIDIRKGLMARVEGGAFEAVINQHFQSFVHPSRLDEAPLMATIRASAMAVGPKAYVRQQNAILLRPDSRPDLGRISCPTLVLCGDTDALTPPELHHEMAAAIPGAEMVEVPACGHLAPLERPDAVNTALTDWLERA